MVAMKKLFLLLLLLPSISFAQTNTMKPLSDVVAELDEVQPENLQYIAFRCMGLFGMMKGITDSSTHAKATEAQKIMKERVMQILEIAVSFQLQVNPSSTPEKFTEIASLTIPPIADNYQIEANQSYIDTGNYFDSKFIIEDMEVCTLLIENFEY